ncbi:MAG TPA: PAS domain S-box protein [Leptospiraceae bacterium]|nr:PAS domain S-box protein [Leptospiraceae bacterium]
MQKNTILIVEDSRPIRSALQRIIERNTQFECIFAETLEETKKLLSAGTDQIFAAILDLELPDALQGEIVDFVSAYRLPSIVFTGKNDETSSLFFNSKPVLDFISKEGASNFHFVARILENLKKNSSENILLISADTGKDSDISDLLRLHNFQITKISSVEDVSSALEKNPGIRLIVSDFIKPTSGDFDFIEKFREKKDKSDFGIIAVISDRDHLSISKLLKRGVNDCIYTPILKEEFFSRIYNLIDNLDNYKLLKKSQYELRKEEKHLREIMDGVDESSIVSRSDIYGKITYVNRQFCEISGFSREELLGKPHNIIRHPDMPASAFADLWKTIKAKKIWTGIIKNRKKNGDAYYVKTLIKPVLDLNGDIEEYISIRQDITDQEEARQGLLQKLSVRSSSINEIQHQSKLFEDILNESSLLMNVGLDGKIKSVNEQYSRVTGFLLSELKSLTVEDIQIKSQEDILTVEKLLSMGSEDRWKGTFCIKDKTERTLYLNAYVLPLKNTVGKMEEYLITLSDITRVMQYHYSMEKAQKELIYIITEAIESNSQETGFHVQRVGEYAGLLGSIYGLSKADCETLRITAALHDLGKIGIPDSILNKPGRLDENEWKIIKTHSEIGYKILQHSNLDILKKASMIAKEHHERWDGTGYPQGLKGGEINIFARITSVADVFDSLNSERCYKNAWDRERILNYFLEQRGHQFDPILVDLLLDNAEKFDAVKKKYEN